MGHHNNEDQIQLCVTENPKEHWLLKKPVTHFPVIEMNPDRAGDKVPVSLLPGVPATHHSVILRAQRATPMFRCSWEEEWRKAPTLVAKGCQTLPQCFSLHPVGHTVQLQRKLGVAVLLETAYC